MQYSMASNHNYATDWFTSYIIQRKVLTIIFRCNSWCSCKQWSAANICLLYNTKSSSGIDGSKHKYSNNVILRLQKDKDGSYQSDIQILSSYSRPVNGLVDFCWKNFPNWWDRDGYVSQLSKFDFNKITTLQEDHFHWNLNFAISPFHSKISKYEFL